MSVSQPESGAAVLPDFSSMTEEEQIAYAMQMSLAGEGEFVCKTRLCCKSRFFVKHVSKISSYWLTEGSEMNTEAAMETSESTKVSHCIILL